MVGWMRWKCYRERGKRVLHTMDRTLCEWTIREAPDGTWSVFVADFATGGRYVLAGYADVLDAVDAAETAPTHPSTWFDHGVPEETVRACPGRNRSTL